VAGKVEAALDADLRRLASLGAPFSATLSAAALALARSLDSGPENTTAGVAKELRATLEKLQEGASDRSGPDLSGLSEPGLPAGTHGGAGPDVPATVGDPAPF
jgi:hypothetical protein